MIALLFALQLQFANAIENGRPAVDGELDSVVALVSLNSGQVLCTGTLIRPDVILTAAHCISKPGVGKVTSFAIYVGNGFASKRGSLQAQYAIRDSLPHPGYLENLGDMLNSTANDIGLVFLRDSIPNARLSALATVPPVREADAPFIIGGFGATYRDFRPETTYGQKNIGRHEWIENDILTPSAITLMEIDGTPRFAKRDSGSAIFNSSGKILGVASNMAPPSGQDGVFSRYTPVFPHLCWISENAGLQFPDVECTSKK